MYFCLTVLLSLYTTVSYLQICIEYLCEFSHGSRLIVEFALQVQTRGYPNQTVVLPALYNVRHLIYTNPFHILSEHF